MTKDPEDWTQWQTPDGGSGNKLDNAEIGALAHLYRGEVYRSTIWRTRLDATTHWSVVTLGLAMSISFTSPNASSLPLLLVGVLITVFLILEARRYRYFNVWRARARWVERHFYAPMLFKSSRPQPGEWQDVLARDYLAPQYHIGFWRAVGRRLRRNYMWIFLVQATAYIGKLIVHPTPLTSMADLLERMAIGPISGMAVLGFGIAFHGAWISIAIYTKQLDRRKHGRKKSVNSMG